MTRVQCAPPHGWPIQKVWLADFRMPAVFPNRIIDRDGSLSSRVVSSASLDDASLDVSFQFLAADPNSSVLPELSPCLCWFL